MKIAGKKLIWLIVGLLASQSLGQSFLSDSAYDITSASSTTPIYHLISLKGSRVESLSRDEKQVLVQYMIRLHDTEFIKLALTPTTPEGVKTNLPVPIIINNV